MRWDEGWICECGSTKLYAAYSPDDIEHRYDVPLCDNLDCGKRMARVAQAGQTLPTDAAERKNVPLVSGVLDYFPAALAEVARISKAGNDQHNPGQPLHWARGKSMDHADCIGRHLADRGKWDVDGQRHSGKLAWRALALLQQELEAEGAPLARGARVPDRAQYGEDAYDLARKALDREAREILEVSV